MVAWILVLGYSGYLLLRYKKGRTLAFIALPVTAAGAFLTASRGSFLWGMINAAVTSVAFIWGAPWRQGQALRGLHSIQRVAIGIALGIVLLFYFYPDGVLSRLEIYQETLLPYSATNELTIEGGRIPWRTSLAPLTTSAGPMVMVSVFALGAQYVSRIFNVKPVGVGVESGFGTLVVEMGIGGLILWIIMSVAILFSAWKVVKKLRGSPWFPLGFVIFWYAFFLLGPATFGGIDAYEDFLLNAYFWLLLGLLFRLPTLALSPQFAIDAPATETVRRWMR